MDRYSHRMYNSYFQEGLHEKAIPRCHIFVYSVSFSFTIDLPGFSTLAEAKDFATGQVMVGLYIRLSKEDDKDGHSESVSNQLAMLEQYVRDHKLTVYDTYIDDGWSGCNFNRPAFSRLLEDIEAGHVNTVISKDLSRLGRDYILTGHYLERYFPEHHVRYISLLDGIDTGTDCSANDITPFRAIMNDMYARDISRKISAVKRDKQKRGQFIGGKPMFGYRMHPTEKNKIIIDETAAPVVQQIFSMALSGMSCQSIARQLNLDRLPSPAVYAGTAVNGQWSGERISEMLQNEIYIGNMVQGRRIKASYKSRKSLRIQKQDWIIVPKTHDGIISIEDFHSVQKILSSRRHTRTRTYDHPLKGMVLCRVCNHPLGIINRKSASGNQTLYFICRSNQHSSGKNSHRVCVKCSTLTDIVTAAIHKFCNQELSANTLSSVASRIIESHTVHHAPSAVDSVSFLMQRINSQIDQICLDRINGILREEDFSRIYTSLCRKRDDMSKIRSVSNSAVSNMHPRQLANDLTAQFLQDIYITRGLLSQLIDHITLDENKQIHICFRFAQPDGVLDGS